MSYFKNFPSIYYDLNRDEKYKLATDILRRVTFNSVAKNHDSLYVKYDITEGETPEEIAHNLYDNHTLYWVILLFNDIINTNKEWPMDADTLDRYITDKYPGTAFYTTFDDSSLDENLISISSGSCSVATNDVYRTGVHTISEGYIATNNTDFDNSSKFSLNDELYKETKLFNKPHFFKHDFLLVLVKTVKICTPKIMHEYLKNIFYKSMQTIAIIKKNRGVVARIQNTLG